MLHSNQGSTGIARHLGKPRLLKFLGDFPLAHMGKYDSMIKGKKFQVPHEILRNFGEPNVEKVRIAKCHLSLIHI